MSWAVTTATGAQPFFPSFELENLPLLLLLLLASVASQLTTPGEYFQCSCTFAALTAVPAYVRVERESAREAFGVEEAEEAEEKAAAAEEGGSDEMNGSGDHRLSVAVGGRGSAISTRALHTNSMLRSALRMSLLDMPSGPRCACRCIPIHIGLNMRR